MQSQGRRAAYLAISVSLGMILSYVEAMIPVFSGVPGMKCGLSNILVVFLLCRFGVGEAALVNFLRILLTSILFSNPFSFAYSLAGAVLSLAGMTFLKNSGRFSVYGFSMAGGMLHNLGQVAVAVFLVENYHVWFYLPILLITGCVTGLMVAFLSALLIRRVRE